MSRVPTGILVPAALAVLPLPGGGQVAGFSLAGHEVEVVGDLTGFSLSVEVTRDGPGLEIAHLRLAAPAPAPPPAFRLRWSLPSHDVQGQWTTSAGLDKTIGPDWYPSRVQSTLARNAPVVALFGGDDGNRLTFAVSDALNPVTLSAGVREEDGRIHGGIDFFQERHREVESVEVAVRFDARPIRFDEALRSVSEWWAARPGYAPAPVPEAGRRPVYSTWYSYHQSVSAEELLSEVEAARPLGFEAIIVDDGWQTLDSHRGYAFTGDWRPERIPDMKGFVDAVHQRGMKLLLWYAVPLVGERSEAYARFRGKFLRYWEGQGAYELDPRYPDVRAHIVDTYRSAIRDWGVDGFKLDFLGRFVANDSTVLGPGNGRDYGSVDEATHHLMRDIMEELLEVEPEVLIEFRQPYVGPLMRTYGNLFRAGDAPNSQVDNRVRVVDLRLSSGTTAVHSDMLMWHPGEAVEDAARQLLNVLFAVPQISVRLESIPPEHLEMVRRYVDYWRDNRDVLLDGGFQAWRPLANYPLVVAFDTHKVIVATYAEVAVPLGDLPVRSRVDVVNATPRGRVVLDVIEALGSHRFRTRDALGRVVSEGSIALDAGAHAIDVPPAGILELVRPENP
jgi:alpha-galactosidase